MHQLITRIGASNANSLVTLDQAEYILAKVSPDDLTDWNALTDDQKKYRLILGASLIGFLPLKGRVAYPGQSLCFPRAYWNLIDAVWECTYRIPDQVKEAQCLAAYCVAHRALATRPAVDSDIEDPIKRLSIGGVLDVTFGTQLSHNILSQLLTSPTSIVYVWMKNFISQFRGGAISAIGDTDIYEPPGTLTSTTTTTSTTSTTTTTSTTSTTSSSTTTTTTTAP